MATISLGVIGLGKIAQVMHVHHAHELEAFELAAVCDLSTALRDVVGRRYGVPPQRRFRRYEDLLATDVDAVLVLNRLHADPVLAALEAGKHVFVEKPLCWTPDDADRIVAAADAAGRAVMVGYMRRYDEGVSLAAAELDRRGTPLFARLHNLAGGRHRVAPAHPVARATDLTSAEKQELERSLHQAMADAVGSDDPRRIALYGLLMELCSHDINLQRRLFGPVERAEGAIAAQRDGATVFSATIVFGSGVRVHWAVAPLFGGGRPWDHELAAFGDAWSLLLRFASPFERVAPTEVVVSDDDGGAPATRTLRTASRSPFACELQAFADWVGNGAAAPTDARDARQDVAFLAALAREAELAA